MCRKRKYVRERYSGWLVLCCPVHIGSIRNEQPGERCARDSVWHTASAKEWNSISTFMGPNIFGMFCLVFTAYLVRFDVHRSFLILHAAIIRLLVLVLDSLFIQF